MNAQGTRRSTENAKAETPPKGDFSSRWWKPVLGGLLLSPLAVLAGDWYMFSSYQRTAAVVPPSAQAPRKPPSLLPPEPKTARPGELVSDLETALAEGLSSPLLYLETTEQEEVFERFQEATARARSGRRLTFFRQPSDRDDVRVYQVRGENEKPQGTLHLERKDSRWCLVRVKEPAGGFSTDREDREEE